MEKNDKISMYQLMVIFAVCMVVPIVRAFPIRISELCGVNSWFVALLIIIPSIVLILLEDKLINGLKDKNGNKIKIKSVSELLDIVYGKYIGHFLKVLYLLWSIMLAALELRLFGERLISTTFIFAPLKFFLLTMLVIVFFLAREKISSFGRFAEIIFEVFLVIFGFICIGGLSNLDIKNVWPITFNRLDKTAFAMIEGFSVFNVISLSMFLGDYVEDTKEYKKYGIIVGALAGVIGSLVMFITTGTFGSTLVEILPQPFFMALKMINLFNVIERIEAIFITFWLVADLMIILYYIFISSNICKLEFKLTKRKFAVVHIVFIVYILALLLAKNYFTLEILSNHIVMKFNLILGVIFPLFTYVIAKIKKQV